MTVNFIGGETMATGPICIITPSGMVCASSPTMRRHYPPGSRKDCGPENPRKDLDKVVEAVKATLSSAPFSVSGQETIATVVQLMVQMDVDDTMPFTIHSTLDRKTYAKTRPKKNAR